MREAITFSDVLLIPQRSGVTSRKDVDTTGRFSRGIAIHSPIVSANMDTITEAPMAIAMAQCGGLGVIHRFLTIEEQATQVAKVKRTETIVIEEPYCLGPRDTVARARETMRQKGVTGLLVVDGLKRLLGIVTRRDIHFEADSSRFLRDVMTTKLVTAKPGLALDKAQEILGLHKIEKLPLVDDKGALRGLITAKDIQMKSLHPHASKDKKGRLLVGAAIGAVGDFIERAEALRKAGADVLVLDVAHGHAEHAIEAIKRVKKLWPSLDLVAGNVATAAGARDLIAAGADGIKVGVGPGSICSTRMVSGSGVPQLTAVMDCAKVCRRKDVPLIADGGIQDSGDMAKALAAGASSVMVGSLLAGTEESPGIMVMRQGTKYKIYRGMASLTATLARRRREDGGRPGFSEEEEVDHIVPEGVESLAPYRGHVSEVVHALVGGVRSGMSYSGARTLDQFWRKARFVRISGAAWRESKPHILDRG